MTPVLFKSRVAVVRGCQVVGAVLAVDVVGVMWSGSVETVSHFNNADDQTSVSKALLQWLASTPRSIKTTHNHQRCCKMCVVVQDVGMSRVCAVELKR